MHKKTLLMLLGGALCLPSTALAQDEDDEDPAGHLRSEIDALSEARFLHGFRLGYLYLMNKDGPMDSQDPNSPALSERYDIRSAHQFLIGYEATWRMVGHDWLNVLLVGNVLVSGLEQSKFFPSANALIGFEMFRTFQIGVGANVMPTRDRPAHMITAAGWTPRVGDFYVPVHAFFVPDVDGHHRTGLTVGVNW